MDAALNSFDEKWDKNELCKRAKYLFPFNRICLRWLEMRSLKYVKMFVGLW